MNNIEKYGVNQVVFEKMILTDNLPSRQMYPIVTINVDFYEPTVFLAVWVNGEIKYKEYFDEHYDKDASVAVELARSIMKEWMDYTPQEVTAKFTKHRDHPNKIKNSSLSGRTYTRPRSETIVYLGVNDAFPLPGMKGHE